MYSPTDFLGTQPSETAEQPKVKLNKWLTLEDRVSLKVVEELFFRKD